jgi:hypothetical protein
VSVLAGGRRREGRRGGVRGQRQDRGRPLRLLLALDGGFDPRRLATVAVTLHRGGTPGCPPRGTGRRRARTPRTHRAGSRRRPRPGTPRRRRRWRSPGRAPRAARRARRSSSWRSSGHLLEAQRGQYGLQRVSGCARTGADCVALLGHAEVILPKPPGAASVDATETCADAVPLTTTPVARGPRGPRGVPRGRREHDGTERRSPQLSEAPRPPAPFRSQPWARNSP